MKIKDLPEMERPYEKLENYGALKLSDAELLAVILKSGSKNMTSVELAQQILLLDEECKGVAFLRDVPLEELQKIKGLGRVKALQIKAVAELAHRIATPRKIYKTVVDSPEKASSLVMDELKDASQEMIKTLLLNSQNELIRIVTNSIGNVNSNYIEMREILKEPIKSSAPKIILVHNHPSGNPLPSKSDIDFTQTLRETSKLFGIELVDHLVIGNAKFTSLKKLGKL